MYSIGIDIGTTSICGVLVDSETGKIIKSRTENSNAFISTPNSWERIQSVDKIISLAKNVTDSLMCGGVTSIGITGQMHGIVYTDGSGKAVSPLYTWQDMRGNLEYKGSTYADFLKSRAGYGNVTDFYNRENGLRPPQAKYFCTIADYFVMILTKNSKPIIHISNAASMGCFNLKNSTFDYDCVAEVTGGTEVIGRYKGINVSVAVGDNQASVFSSIASDNNILINVGTGSQVSVISDRPVDEENIETRPYFDNKFLIVGAALCGGKAYSMLKNFYQALFDAAGIEAGDVYMLMDKLLRNVRHTDIKTNTRFSGTRSDKLVRGSISNISDTNFTPENLTYSFVCGIIAELHEMFLKMNVRRSGIVASGNGIRKNAAMQLAAEKIFGGTVKIPVYPEEAAVGAAMLAMAANGAKTEDLKSLIKYL